MHALLLVNVVFISALVPSTVTRTIEEEYNHDRLNLIEAELEQSLGGQIILSDDEVIANNILMHYKHTELNASLQNDPEYYSFSKPFIKYRRELDRSLVHQIIRIMPKGAALHTHSSLMLGPDFMLNMTYEDHLYNCVEGDNLQLLFSDVPPQRPCTSNWTLFSDVRKASDDISDFDEDLKERFMLFSEGDAEIPSINEVWRKFNEVHKVIKSIITYRPITEKFFYEILNELYNDNVMYAEIRSGLSRLYELNGTKHDELYLARLYYDINNKFVQEHPNFLGVKLIVTHVRHANKEIIQKKIELTRRLKAEMPNFIAGFDLVGQEDLGNPLKEYMPILADARNYLNFFFHGGETNWFGTSTDENIIDAILLGTKRLGHGYSLIKHPALMNAVKNREIALEVNVISNVMLSLVNDVRNHPLAAYFARDLPVVVSSDDPGVWGATPLSDDFYVAFMGVANVNADLKLLKQLAINSLSYSTLNNIQKRRAFAIFNDDWNRFIEELVADNVRHRSLTTLSDINCNV